MLGKADQIFMGVVATTVSPSERALRRAFGESWTRATARDMVAFGLVLARDLGEVRRGVRQRDWYRSVVTLRHLGPTKVGNSSRLALTLGTCP